MNDRFILYKRGRFRSYYLVNGQWKYKMYHKVELDWSATKVRKLFSNHTNTDTGILYTDLAELINKEVQLSKYAMKELFYFAIDNRIIQKRKISKGYDYLLLPRTKARTDDV